MQQRSGGCGHSGGGPLMLASSTSASCHRCRRQRCGPAAASQLVSASLPAVCAAAAAAAVPAGTHSPRTAVMAWQRHMSQLGQAMAHQQPAAGAGPWVRWGVLQLPCPLQVVRHAHRPLPVQFLHSCEACSSLRLRLPGRCCDLLRGSLPHERCPCLLSSIALRWRWVPQRLIFHQRVHRRPRQTPEQCNGCLMCMLPLILSVV